MAERKSTRKAPDRKKAAARKKPGAGKTTSGKSGRASAGSGKGTGSSKAAGKGTRSSKAAGKGTGSSRTAGPSGGVSKAAASSASRGSAAKPRSPRKKAAGTVSSVDVNLGHVFALRPRVTKSFRQADFLTARLQLEEESYASIEEAARAVVAKALDLTQRGPSKRDPRR